MREIEDHLIAESSAVEVMADDKPDSTGAIGRYVATVTTPEGKEILSQAITFQNGPRREVGSNGISEESLMAIVLDRLRSYQETPFVSADTAEAIRHLESSLTCLQRRSIARKRRGVDGTNMV
jgi:hypothetical protein